jgi:hypothetical protein
MPLAHTNNRIQPAHVALPSLPPGLNRSLHLLHRYNSIKYSSRDAIDTAIQPRVHTDHCKEPRVYTSPCVLAQPINRADRRRRTHRFKAETLRHDHEELELRKLLRLERPPGPRPVLAVPQSVRGCLQSTVRSEPWSGTPDSESSRPETHRRRRQPGCACRAAGA